MYTYILADQRLVCRQHDELGHSSVVETRKVLKGGKGVNIQARPYIYTYTYIYISISISISIDIHICICMYVCIYVYAQTHIHTQTPTHSHKELVHSPVVETGQVQKGEKKEKKG